MGYIGVITQLRTIDPNFLGHPSGGFIIKRLAPHSNTPLDHWESPTESRKRLET